VLGTWLAQGSNLDRERHFYYWSGQFLAGAPVMIVEAVHGHALVTGEIEYADAGLVFACLAGLLNILCLLDVQAFGVRRLIESADVEPAGARRPRRWRRERSRHSHRAVPRDQRGHRPVRRFLFGARRQEGAAPVPASCVWFIGGCLILVAVVLLIEHTVARVS
jgi:hypothetical protein